MSKIVLPILIFFVVGCAYGQNENTTRQMIDAINVPKNVSLEFKKMYPRAYVIAWYVTNISYWYEDYGSSYYNGWYQNRTVVVYTFTQPSYYEAEFMTENEIGRAIFNRYGTWFETRTRVYKLPDKVESALQQSDFYNWKWSDYKERIEAPGMPGSVYRLNVSNNQSSQIIRLNNDGEVVQIKTEQK